MKTIYKRFILIHIFIFVMFLSAGGSVSAKSGDYYYKQLTASQKAIYDAIVNSAMTHGNMKPFLIARSPKFITNDVDRAVDAYNDDHMEVFWAVTDNYYLEKNEGMWEYYLEPAYYAGFAKRNTTSDIKSVNNVVTRLVKDASKKKTDYDKLLYVHNWLVKNNVYNNKAFTQAGYNLIPWTPMSALVKGYNPVCAGYSRAFKMVCDELGIPCLIVYNSGHEWNYVSLYDKWYGVDLTYDDPLVIGGSNRLSSGRETTRYFLVGSDTKIGSKTFIKTHRPEGVGYNGTALLKLPTLEKDKFVNKSVKSVTLNKTTAKLDMTKRSNPSVVIKAGYSPSNASIGKGITWTTNRPDLVDLKINGQTVTVTPKGEVNGTVKVTATSGNKKAKTCKVTLKAPVHVTGLSLNKTNLSVKVKKSVTIRAKISPSKATNKKVTWTSSDTSVATVNSSGKVTGKKAGNAVITATSLDGGKIARCSVTVTEETKKKKNSRG